MASSLPKVKIVIVGPGIGDSYIEVDGVRLKGTHAVEVDHSVGELANIRIDLWADELTVEVDGADLTLGIADVRAIAAREKAEEKALTDQMAAEAERVKFREFL